MGLKKGTEEMRGEREPSETGRNMVRNSDRQEWEKKCRKEKAGAGLSESAEAVRCCICLMKNSSR